MKAAYQTRKLGDLCHIARGGSPRPIQDYLTDAPDGINWVKISDATASDKYIEYTKEKIRPEGLKKSRLVKPGDFILSNSMSFGRPYIMKTTGCIHDGWLVLSDKCGLFNPDFLYHFLGSDTAYRQFDGLAAGSTVRNLNSDLVKTVDVPIPPLDEQRRIVAVLDKAFAGIATATANAQKNLTNARALFDGYLETLFIRNEGEWKAGSLNKIAGNVSTGPFGSLLHKSDYVENGIPLVNPAHIVGDRIEPDLRKTISSKTLMRLTAYVLAENDIVIGRRGEIGRCAVVTSKESGWLCGTGCFFIRPKKSVNAHFLAHLLRSRPYREALESMATGATMLNLGNTALGDLEIALPSLACQNDHVAHLDEISALVGKLEGQATAKLTALTELKQSLLHKAFAGELT